MERAIDWGCIFVIPVGTNAGQPFIINLMLNQTIHLAIIDDHILFGKTLKNYLSEQADINVLLQCSDVPALLDGLKTTGVDILLMDLFMPGLTGIDTIRTIRTTFPDIKIIILSMNTDLAVISDLLDSGIHGYLSKADEPEELLQVIRNISQNRMCRSRLFTEALYWNRQNSLRMINGQQQDELNDREKKIIRLLWEEKSNKEIADELFIGIRTVERTRQEMKEKVGVKSTVGLIKFAIQKKIIFGPPISISGSYQVPFPLSTD
jgi:DNA-binding NarL/FixJ family response regulator